MITMPAGAATGLLVGLMAIVGASSGNIGRPQSARARGEPNRSRRAGPANAAESGPPDSAGRQGPSASGIRT